MTGPSGAAILEFICAFATASGANAERQRPAIAALINVFMIISIPVGQKSFIRPDRIDPRLRPHSRGKPTHPSGKSSPNASARPWSVQAEGGADASRGSTLFDPTYVTSLQQEISPNFCLHAHCRFAGTTKTYEAWSVRDTARYPR